jgi:uridine kinase
LAVALIEAPLRLACHFIMRPDCFVVGIAGLSASGKTSLLRDLIRRLPDAAILSQDNYYRPFHEQTRDAWGEVNFDLPTAFLQDDFRRDVQTLLQGQPVTRTEYTFNTPHEVARQLLIAPADVLILEGLFVFHDAELRGLIDLHVFVDADLEVCLQRRLQRDVRERGYTIEAIMHQWQHHVLPAYHQFVLPHRDEAHVIVDNNCHYEEGLAALCRRVHDRV